MTLGVNFWQSKKLEEMTQEEWEALCDGCGRCCLNKIVDAETDQVLFTCVACRLFDPGTCLCKHYQHRNDIVPDCLVLTPENVRQIEWLPESCAYRRIAEGRGLAWWHPLVSGTSETVRQAGISVQGGLISEIDVDLYGLEDYIVNWFN